MTLSLRCRPGVVPPAPVEAFHAGARGPDPDLADPLTWLVGLEPLVPGGPSRRPRLGGVPAPRTPEVAVPTDAFSLGAPSWQRIAVASLAAAVPLSLAAPAYGQEAPEEEPAAAEVSDDLSYVGERVWASLRGERIEVTLAEGVQVAGVLLTQADGEVAIAADPDGEVVRVPKGLVLRVRLVQPEPQDFGAEIDKLAEAIAKARAGEDEVVKEKVPPNGKGALGVGAALTGAGAGMVTTFVVGTAANYYFPYYGGSLFMIVGQSLLGPGIPLLITGAVQSKDFKRWQEERELAVSLAPTQGGFTGQIRLRW